MPWRYWITTILIVVSLLGLALVQYYLVYTRLTVEKWRFDRDMRSAIQQSREKIQADPDLQEDILALYRKEAVNREKLQDQIRELINTSIQAVNENPKFKFALYEQRPFRAIVLADTGYVVSRVTDGRYRRPLDGSLNIRCNCSPELEIQIQSLVPYLIGRLRIIIIPSILFLLLLLVSLLLFLRWLSRLRQLNRSQHDFINHLTHELKTPVFSSQLLLRLLGEANERGDKEAIDRYNQLLKGENQRLEQQTARILELATWDKTKLPLQKSSADLHQLIEEEAKVFREQAVNRGGQLALDLEAPLAQFSFDTTLWRDVIRNLLDNALKYQSDPPKIKLSTSGDAQRIRLSIADRGPGIPRKLRKAIFGKFYRGPGTTNSGYGLGLTHVKRIVQAHLGRIWVEDQDGGGARFVIELPLVDAVML